MPAKENRAQVNPCPFTAQQIQQKKDLKKLDYHSLSFAPFSLPGKQTKVKKYTFASVTREKSGVFIFRDPNSNRILACGSTTKSLREVIWKSIARYRITSDALLAVVETPAGLAAQTLLHLKETYGAKPVDTTFQKMLPYLTSAEHLPIEAIVFHPLFSKHKSSRHKSRTKTSFGYLNNRPGLYFIKEREKGFQNSEIVYVGKTRANLLKRIYAHFIPSRLSTGDVCYCNKLQSHEYEIGVIEVPQEEYTIKKFDKYLCAYERMFIGQLNPRDNRMWTTKQPDKDEWFDEGLPEVENEFAVLKKIRI